MLARLVSRLWNYDINIGRGEDHHFLFRLGVARLCRAPKADRHGLSRRKAEHNRRSVDTLESEERGPTAGVAGSSLSSTAGRLAAPLRGKHSRREDGRLDRLSRRGDRLAGSGRADGFIWRVDLHAAASSNMRPRLKLCLHNILSQQF